jgi:exosome complex RNA-binding protein Csl4
VVLVSEVDDQTSLGDARSYYLSTAQNEYGVISGRSEAGQSTNFQEQQLITDALR